MKQFNLSVLIGSSLLLTSAASIAQDQHGEAPLNQSCMYNIEQSAPLNRYRINSGGATVFDKVTGLTWSRCDLGQVWNDSLGYCEGEKLTVNWLDANAQATSYDVGGLTGWRLPNIKELATLTEDRCYLPAMNTEIFNTGTGMEYYYSSTPYVFDATHKKVMVFSSRLSEILAYEKDNTLNVKYVLE